MTPRKRRATLASRYPQEPLAVAENVGAAARPERDLGAGEVGDLASRYPHEPVAVPENVEAGEVHDVGRVADPT